MTQKPFYSRGPCNNPTHTNPSSPDTKLFRSSLLRVFFSWTDASWLIQRATAIMILPCLLFGDISVLAILIILASCHFYIGVTEIFTDYIHGRVTRLLLNILFSFFVLILLKESLMILGFIWF